ncbi:MAG: hypothetical protein HDS80_03580 [Bacteroidales bacterium]|nr:hypothetical protein [Bacteroidales bacterium]MBD5209011.1 hypothetical protein [Bacteroidales bacterium]
MSKVRISLNIDQLNLIRYLSSKVEKSPELSKKFDKCMDSIVVSEVNSSPKETLEEIRKKHTPGITAKFLSQFEVPSGLKFLTHNFDPDSNMTMATVIKQVSSIISSQEYNYKLPGSLYGLIINFIRGEKKWLDYNNESHSTNLSSGGLKNWIDSNPTLHPITSPQYGNEIQAFRRTVRIAKPVLPELISSLINKITSLQNLQIKTEKLDKADFYTNVNRLIHFIIGNVLSDIAQRNSSAEVLISYQRSSWNEIRLHKILITHIDSEANPFEDVQKKICSGGGALYELAKNCQGYCDWAVEANFEGEYKRWRILSAQNLPEIEIIDKNEVKGFTHIFTFYKQ